MTVNWLHHGKYMRGKCCSPCRDSSHPVLHSDKANPFSCIENLETVSIIESIHSLELEGKIPKIELLKRASAHSKTKTCGNCAGEYTKPEHQTSCGKAKEISKDIQDLIEQIDISPRKRIQSEQDEYDELSDDEKEIIELFAVEKAEQYYQRLGYKIEDVSVPAKATNAGLSDWPGYDLLATKGNEVKRIEVKGTKQGYGSPIQITSNEVNKAKDIFREYYLFIVYSIVIENKQAKHGVIKIIEQWNPQNSIDDGELVPKDYFFTPKRRNNDIS